MNRTWELTDQLAAAHGITALFVLQPVHSSDPSYANVYRYVHPRVRRFLDLSQYPIPDDDWIDFAHLTAEGNARIAAQIARAL